MRGYIVSFFMLQLQAVKKTNKLSFFVQNVILSAVLS